MTAKHAAALEADFRLRSREATRSGDGRGEMIWEVAADLVRDAQQEATEAKQKRRAQSLGLRLTR